MRAGPGVVGYNGRGGSKGITDKNYLGKDYTWQVRRVRTVQCASVLLPLKTLSRVMV